MKILICLIFLSQNLLAEEYWRPPIVGLKETLTKKEGQLYSSWRGSFIGADFPSVFVYLSSMAVEGFDIAQNKDLLKNYKHTLEHFSESLLDNNSNVVKPGEFKKSKDFLYTFYLNHCFALIINNKENIIMLHGWGSGKSLKDSIKIAKKLLSEYTGDVYLISNKIDDKMRELNSDRIFNVIHKPDTLIGSFKAYKEDGNFYIKGEFHPNDGVNLTIYDKLMAHYPWGPMSQLKFEKYK